MAKPAAKAATKKATTKATTKPAVEATVVEDTPFGVADIVEIIKTRTGKETKTRDLRVLLRKMARDGRLNREIVAGNRERWVWSGPNDPEVEKIIEAFEDGELEADKREKLEALKAKKAEQRAAKKAEQEAAAADESDEELEEDDEE